MTAREQAIITIVEAAEDLDLADRTVADAVAGVLDAYLFKALVESPLDLHPQAGRASRTLVELVERHPDAFRHLDDTVVQVVELIASLAS